MQQILHEEVLHLDFERGVLWFEKILAHSP